MTLILDKIHQQNWLHQDIKPPNIMLRNSGELVLIDFGTAGTAREETQTYHQKGKGQQVTGITSVGYTPNEQQHSQAVIQSDFYALGRTFVHLLTGKHPLEIYDAVNDVLAWREETENIHPLLLDFIDELMGRLPKNRPANTRVILQRLDQIERQLKLPPTTPNRPSPPPNPPPIVTQKQSPVIPKINSSPPVSPVAVPQKTPGQPIKKNKLRNRMIALGGVLLLGVGITQAYGYFKSQEINSPQEKKFSEHSFPDKTLTGHSDEVFSVAYSPDGRYLASGSIDQTIKIWEVATGKELRTLTGHSGGVFLVAYSPDGRYLASGSIDQTIKIWEVATGKELRTLTVYSYLYGADVVYSPDGRYLASRSDDKTIKIWEVATGKELRTLTGHSGPVLSVVYSPDGRYLASGGGLRDNTIKIWQVATGKVLRTLTGHSDWVLSVVYSPDGRYLASGSRQTIKIWQVATGKVLRTLTGHSDWVWSVVYSPDGRYLASGSYQTIKIWEVATGKELRTLTGHSHSVKSVVYSPDGRYLASGSGDKTIKIWRVGQ
jgi:WD40 repeat protein